MAPYQSTGASSYTSGTFQTVAFVSNNVAGNTLIASGYVGVNTTSPYFSDTQGNTWQVIAYLRNWFGSDTLVVGCAFNCKAGANSVTFYAGTSTYVSLGCIAEVSGVNAISGVSIGAIGSGTSFASNSLVVPETNSFLYCAIGELGAISGTSPFTVIGGPPASVYNVGAWVTEASAGTYSCSGTVTTGGWGAILVSFYQATTGDPVLAQVPTTFSNGSSTTQSIPYLNNNTAGNGLVLVAEYSNGSTLTTSAVTDSQGNNWTRLYNSISILTSAGSYWWVEVWYAPNCKAGANTVQIALGSSSATNGVLYEFANILAANPADQASVSIATGTAVDAGPLYLPYSDELVLSYMLQITSSGITVTPGTNYIPDYNLSNELVIQRQRSGSVGTYHGDMTLSSSETWIAGMVSFKSTNSAQTAPTISSLTFSASDTTIAATWTTDVVSDSHLTAGVKVAADDGLQTAVTSHWAIVAGLSPNTVYSCVVMSGATSSTPQNVTTGTSPTRHAVTSSTLSAVLNTGTQTGDDTPNFVSNDGILYICQDDGAGFDSSPNAGADLQVCKLTNETTITGPVVNLLTNYGGAGGSPDHKQTGIFGMLGNLYLFQNISVNTVPIGETTGHITKSTDKGATWNNYQTPNVYNVNGLVPQWLGSGQFATNSIGAVTPVLYAADDGTIGYATAGNKIDGADAYVYCSYVDGALQNNNDLYLLRIPRQALDMQWNIGQVVQYWKGPASPAPSDFVNDSNWSLSTSGRTSIYHAVSQVCWSYPFFVPKANRYILPMWYYPNGTSEDNTNTTQFVFQEGPTPAGPWTQILSQTNNPQGYDIPVPMHRTVESNTKYDNIPIDILFSGDYSNDTYYTPHRATLTLVTGYNPTAKPVIIIID